MTATRDLPEALAPPMVNGELNFNEPWEGRIFAMANALCDAQVFEWSEFQSALIQELKGVDDESFHYYKHFQAALETLLFDKQCLAKESLSARAGEYAARPHGHDH